MKKSFRNLFSGLVGLLIIGALFGIVIKVSAAITAITVNSPNGGEILNGTTVITWTETGTGDAVNIFYSTDGGASYPGIVALNVTGETLTYNWDTTSLSDGSSYKIKVRIAGGPDDPQDTSNANFTIDNTGPAVDAGADRTENELFGHGTATASDDNGIASLLWSQVSGPGIVTLGSATSMGTTMEADTDGTYVMELLATDTLGNTGADTMTLVWDATAPTVDVGSDIVTNHAVTITGTADFSVAGTGTYHRDNNTTHIGFFTIPGAVDNQPTLNITNASANGVYTVQLTVVDNAGNTNYDTLNLTRDTTKPIVASGYVTPNPGSGTVNVVIVFTETLSDLNVSIAPHVYVNDGSYHAVAPLVDGDHTNGYDSELNIWEGTISVAGLNDGTATLIVTGATDVAENVMIDNTNAGTFAIDEEGPTFTINDGVAAGPVQTDTINITVNDTTLVASLLYAFSSDTTCDASDSYDYGFTSASNFSITGDYTTDYLCIQAIDTIGNISYTGGRLLNTDNTAPIAPIISTGVMTPRTGTTPTLGIITTELSGTIRVYSGGVLFFTVSPINSGADTIPLYTTSLTEGIHSEFSIAFVDFAGNISSPTSVDTFTIDLTNPVVNSLSTSFETFTNDTTPTFIGNVTDNLTDIVSVEYSLDEGNTWTGVTASDGTFDSLDEDYTITTDELIDGERYIEIRATDTLGHVSTTTGYSFFVDTQIPTLTFNIPTDASTTMNIAGNAINTGSSPISQIEYFIDTVGSDDAGHDLVLATGTTTRNFNGSISLSGLTNGPHVLYVHAKNLAGSRGATIYDSFNVNSAAPDILNLLMSDITNNSATINWASDVVPDTAEYRIKTNNSSFTSWLSLGETEDIEDLSSNITYIVEIRLGIGDNYSTDTISFTTASAADGIIVDSLARILNTSTPTAGGGYASGYHFRFTLTINDIFADILNFKLADWSNAASTMAVANNTKIYLSTNGISTAEDASDSATLTGSNVYSSDLNFAGIDANQNKGGKQVILDMFYKIPVGAQGIFSTSYGIRVSNSD